MHRNGAAIALLCGSLAVACGSSAVTGGFTGNDADGGVANTPDGGNSASSGGPGSSSGAGSGSTSGGSSGGGGSDGGGTASSSSGGGTSSGIVTGDDGGSCAIGASNVRVTEVDVGSTVAYSEVDNNGSNVGLKPLAISPIPSGGSRLAWLGGDGNVHVAALDASDQLVAGSAFGLPAYDFEDLYADDSGGVLLVSRGAGGNTSTPASPADCGNINNLCGLVANYPTADPCMDMFLVRFDATTETWAAKLTDTTAALPAYDTSPTATTNVVFIWWYAHNGRIAFDGANYGAYFGAAISVSQTCVQPSTMTTGINIHQGDRLKIVNSSGAVQSGGFSFGCSHSAYERLIWDPGAKKFVAVCENDAPTGGLSGRIAIAPNTTTVYAEDLANSNFGNVLVDPAGGYWAITTNTRAGQTTGAAALSDVLLLHFTTGMADSPPLTVASDSGLNDRAPHLASFGTNRMLAAWETSTRTGDLSPTDTSRKLYVQALNASTGAPEGAPFNVAGVLGSRYDDFRSFPDGSVAFPAPSSTAATNTKIKIARVMPCP